MARVFKAVRAEYDATLNTLRLAKPLEGINDHEEVIVTVELPASMNSELMKFRGILSGEDGESFAKAIDEMFPIEIVAPADRRKRWSEIENSIPAADGEDLARAIREMFPEEE